MATETATQGKSNAVRIQQDKLKRAARVARKEAVVKDEDVSIASVVDEILEEGLAKRERKFGIV
jgi:hypothetical protein